MPKSNTNISWQEHRFKPDLPLPKSLNDWFYYNPKCLVCGERAFNGNHTGEEVKVPTIKRFNLETKAIFYLTKLAHFLGFHKYIESEWLSYSKAREVCIVCGKTRIIHFI